MHSSLCFTWESSCRHIFKFHNCWSFCVTNSSVVKSFWTIFTLPAAAVAKYCNERISVCVCVPVCLRVYPLHHMCDLYQIFGACCLWPWLSPPPAGWCNPKGKGQFWGFTFPLTMHCMGHIAVWILLQRTDLALIYFFLYLKVGQNSIFYY